MKIHKLPQNRNLCFKGVELNGKGFVLSKEQGKELIENDLKNHDVIKDLLTGRDLNQRVDQSPSRCVIDFQDWSLEKAREYKDCFELVEKKKKRKNFWQFSNPFKNQRKLLKPLKKFIVTSRVSKYRFFNFVENKNVLPESAVCFFPLESYAFLGILSSKFHIEWAKYNGSSLKGDSRYTNTTCFETFPFPEEKENEKVSSIMLELESYRKDMCLKQNIGMTTLYNQMFEGKQPILKELHTQLDHAVAELYHFPTKNLSSKKEILKHLIKLNREFYEAFHGNSVS